jgi:pyruvate/2-oxoglutarate dehydrogenase complex dihydrolipoamide dehydrogenase (E3) component
VGGGPAGIAAALEAAASGHRVVLFERANALGGQIGLAGAAPGNRGISEAFVSMAERRLEGARVETRLATAATVDDVLGLQPEAVVVATGATPFVDERVPLDGVESVSAWDVLAGNAPRGRNVVVADWGGDPGGLDAAEVLASAGASVTLAVESVAVGEGVHQYRRNLYLQRLYRAGVTIAHHLALVGAAGGRVDFRNVFAPDVRTTFTADLLVIARGRVPFDELSGPLGASGVRVETAGDCCSPRSLEEAVLEGTLAARNVIA